MALGLSLYGVGLVLLFDNTLYRLNMMVIFSSDMPGQARVLREALSVDEVCVRRFYQNSCVEEAAGQMSRHISHGWQMSLSSLLTSWRTCGDCGKTLVRSTT